MNLRIASRGSALALRQAREVAARLEAANRDLTTEIVIVHTEGDRITDVPLSRMGTVGIFTREVDNAVLDKRAHAAVHSLKDVPTTPPAGLRVAAVLEREDPRDALIVAPGLPRHLADLPPSSRIGTSSLRRKALLLSQRGDLRVDDLRGNLDTRLARVASGDYDAAILALAGIRRLERTDAVAEILEAPAWLPAPGQGAIAVVVAELDDASGEIVGTIDHAPSRAETAAERAFLSALQGGCQVPIGALARLVGETLTLDGFVASLDGAVSLRGQDSGALSQPDRIGWRLAASLLQRGAADLLASARTTATAAMEEP